ncbi:MAG: glycoside hydrolase family 15 protein [Blastocatellia bacterium]|nr:glycoside hydrolase family 15 protein [Blastocatellia bacterium]
MRDIPVGNGSLLVTFDDKYQIRDIYFPHVGQENQTEGSAFRFGIWVDDEFSWLSSDDWSRDLRYLDETLVTDVRLVNESLGIEIICNDTVASHENIFLRRFSVINNRDTSRNVRVFLHEDFRLYENKVGDTVYFDPLTKSLIHYQKSRYFLIKSDPLFSSFATGRKDFQGHEGTWRDAEDGVLQGAAITEGSADSTICIELSLEPNGSAEAFYWIAAGKSYDEVKLLDAQVADRTPDRYIDYTGNYWRAWVNKNDTDLSALPADTQAMFKRSLLIVHTQIDNGGAIIAANDWDVTLRATDHYSYLWTRDGALVANALDLAGFSHLTRKFFRFCETLVHPDGYFLQKYNADSTVASGWHAAWDPHSQTSLVPIQEDETALVLWALWEHYQLYRDIEFAHRLYRSVTVPCADFMAAFIGEDLGLPQPSWNLWEDRRGIHTFTCATVVAGLRAAANFAVLFAEHDRALKYSDTANRIQVGMREHLYSEKDGRFLRSLQSNGNGYEPDATVDASLFGTFYFGCFDPSDPLVTTTMSAIEEYLSVPGGIARFENDGYMRISDDGAGNAWVICTIWLAEYYIAKAQNLPDLDLALAILRTVQESALPSGVMAEQIDPETNGPVSVSPLTWSHSSFVAACINYCRKKAKLL